MCSACGRHCRPPGVLPQGPAHATPVPRGPLACVATAPPQFVVVYSLSPVGDLGSVFRRFPSLWQASALAVLPCTVLQSINHTLTCLHGRCTRCRAPAWLLRALFRAPFSGAFHSRSAAHVAAVSRWPGGLRATALPGLRTQPCGAPRPQVFVADSETPGRFRLAAEKPSRPDGEELDLILMQVGGWALRDTCASKAEQRGG